MQALFSFSPEKFCILLCLLQILTTRYGAGGKILEKIFPNRSRVRVARRMAPNARRALAGVSAGRKHATVSALRPWRYWTRKLPKSYVNRRDAMSRSRSTRSSGARRTPSAAPAACSRARSARSLPWSRKRAFLLSVWGIRILPRTPSGRSPPSAFSSRAI